MAKIKSLRPVLLSAPYADLATSQESQLHLPSGYRTVGLVEIVLDNGIKGLGEGYIAVFAPHVFISIVELLKSYIIGTELTESNIQQLFNRMQVVTGYWSWQGAARHVISAVEIALYDCLGIMKQVPLYKLFGGEKKALRLYGSGGDSIHPEAMMTEFETLKELKISIFKIRARSHQANKVLWCLEYGRNQQIEIAVDMTQNLCYPGASVKEILKFHNVIASSGKHLFFLEEALGLKFVQEYKKLRGSVSVKVAGGEVLTRPEELMERMRRGYYDIVQPDAIVIGGIRAVLEIFVYAKKLNIDVYVHCWGSSVGMLANYHAAIAGGGEVVEWPLPSYSLREVLLVEPWNMKDGHLLLSDAPGLGVHLTPETEQQHRFREDSVYQCLPVNTAIRAEEKWQIG